MTTTARTIASFIADPANFSYHHTAEFYEGWLSFTGNEHALVGLLGSPALRNHPALPDLVAFVRSGVELGIFGHGWHQVSVKIGDYPTRGEVEEVLPVDGCFVTSVICDYNNDKTNAFETTRRMLVLDDRESVGPYRIDLRHPRLSMTATDMLACLDAITTTTAPRAAADNAYAQLIHATTLAPAAMHMLFGDAGRSFTAMEHKVAKHQLEHLLYRNFNTPRFALSVNLRLLAGAVPEENPVSYIQDGPDVAAMTRSWVDFYGEAQVHLSAEAIAKALKHYRPWDDVCVDLQWEVGRSRFKPEQMNRSDFHSYLYAFLHLTAEVPLNDPARTFVAKKLIWLQEHAKAVLTSALEFAAVALGASYNDPQFDVVKSPGLQGIRLLLEGHVDDYVADLQTTRDRPGCFRARSRACRGRAPQHVGQCCALLPAASCPDLLQGRRYAAVERLGCRNPGGCDAGTARPGTHHRGRPLPNRAAVVPARRMARGHEQRCPNRGVESAALPDVARHKNPAAA